MFSPNLKKKINSTNPAIESDLNIDKRLTHHKTESSDMQPNQKNLTEEINFMRSIYKKAPYLNSLSGAFPSDCKKALTFLGMEYVTMNDYVYMKAKPLLLRSKVRTSTDALLRNPGEFESFIESTGLTRSKVAAITASL